MVVIAFDFFLYILENLLNILESLCVFEVFVLLCEVFEIKNFRADSEELIENLNKLLVREDVQL